MSNRVSSIVLLPTAAALLAPAAGCADDPVYVTPPTPVLEVNAGDMGAPTAMRTVALPIRVETDDDVADREARAAELGVPADSIPYVKLGDMDVSIEWTLRNLDDAPAVARIDVNGANQWWRFVPELFDIDEDEDEVQPPPPLVDGPPLQLEPLETRSGVVREDQLVEAAIDLDLMSRAGADPVVVLLGVDEDTPSLVDSTTGVTLPRDVFAGLVELELRLSGTAHLVLEFTVRVRDHRGLLHDQLGAAPPDELAVFTPADLMPPMPDPGS